MNKLILILSILVLLPLYGQTTFPKHRDEAYALLKPYTGKSNAGVNTKTLDGKLICGYQGWFSAEGDGAGLGWRHYSGKGGEFKPGNCTIDLWPDLKGFDKSELYPTAFKHKNGQTAYTFSSNNRKTVGRHFLWMKDYNIDGVFLQRFGSSLKNPKLLNHRNRVLNNVQEGANHFGRTWAIMYDLSGLKSDKEIESTVIYDWKQMIMRKKIRQDKAYLHHNGKPVVAIWGVGFGDDRKYSLKACERLIDFLKDNPEFGGNTVMLGIPSFWQTQERDATKDKDLHRVLKKADILSPWTVGRYRLPIELKKYGENVVKPNQAWCKANKKDYMPVIFPGFSWQNLKKTKGINEALNKIPRNKGQFLWDQARMQLQHGAKMIYVAMFDEIDEGTAIFKCTNNPPSGASNFMTYDGLPSDHYLWLSGQINNRIESTKLQKELPKR